MVEGVEGVARRRLGDYHGPAKARLEVVEDAVHRLDVGCGELVCRRDVVRLDDNVLLVSQARLDLVVDGDERVVNIAAAVLAVDESDASDLRNSERLGQIGRTGMSDGGPKHLRWHQRTGARQLNESSARQTHGVTSVLV